MTTFVSTDEIVDPDRELTPAEIGELDQLLEDVRGALAGTVEERADTYIAPIAERFPWAKAPAIREAAIACMTAQDAYNAAEQTALDMGTILDYQEEEPTTEQRERFFVAVVEMSKAHITASQAQLALAEAELTAYRESITTT